MCIERTHKSVDVHVHVNATDYMHGWHVSACVCVCVCACVCVCVCVRVSMSTQSPSIMCLTSVTQAIHLFLTLLTFTKLSRSKTIASFSGRALPAAHPP